MIIRDIFAQAVQSFSNQDDQNFIKHIDSLREKINERLRDKESASDQAFKRALDAFVQNPSPEGMPSSETKALSLPRMPHFISQLAIAAEHSEDAREFLHLFANDKRNSTFEVAMIAILLSSSDPDQSLHMLLQAGRLGDIDASLEATCRMIHDEKHHTEALLSFQEMIEQTKKSNFTHVEKILPTILHVLVIDPKHTQRESLAKMIEELFVHADGNKIIPKLFEILLANKKDFLGAKISTIVIGKIFGIVDKYYDREQWEPYVQLRSEYYQIMNVRVLWEDARDNLVKIGKYKQHLKDYIGQFSWARGESCETIRLALILFKSQNNRQNSTVWFYFLELVTPLIQKIVDNYEDSNKVKLLTQYYEDSDSVTRSMQHKLCNLLFSKADKKAVLITYELRKAQVNDKNSPIYTRNDDTLTGFIDYIISLMGYSFSKKF